MTDKLIFPQQPIIPVQQQTPKTPAKTPINQGPAFNQVFKQEINKASLKFSQHAQQRLQARNINLSPQEIQKLDSAVAKAAAKGAKESLVLMKDVAFVVSVKNKTVITAVDGASLKDNVFTNIDSAVII